MSSSRHSFPSVAIVFPIHLAQPGERETFLSLDRYCAIAPLLIHSFQSCDSVANNRISHDRYEYSAPSVGYADVLEVDDYGAIVRYPQLWEQER